MPNLLLVGPTNNGKTMIVEKFRRSHPSLQASAAAEGVARIPVLKVQMPASPDERRFFGAILQELGVPSSASDRLAIRQEFALRLMRSTAVQLLVIDEAHNLLSGPRLQQRRFLNCCAGSAMSCKSRWWRLALRKPYGRSRAMTSSQTVSSPSPCLRGGQARSMSGS
jgi:hypothetical protein